jgi:methyl-accepting chemotaxis protein
MKVSNKIGLSFGLVCFLLLIVAGQYQTTLWKTQESYNQVLDQGVALKNHAMTLNNLMLQARRSEKDFLLRYKMKYAERVESLSAKMHEKALTIKTLGDSIGGSVGEKLEGDAKKLEQSITDYSTSFESLVSSWKKKGLDPKSGLQGQFRKAAHNIGGKIKDFDFNALYITMLQMRRAEKDFIMRKNTKYVKRMGNLVQHFNQQTLASTLNSDLKKKMFADSANYLSLFKKFSHEVLSGHEPSKALVSKFRSAVHDMEASMKSHYVEGFDHYYLDTRKNEKDYILRGAAKYIKKVDKNLAGMVKKIDKSSIPNNIKSDLKDSVGVYKKAFHALVGENDKITNLTKTLREAVHAIEPIVDELSMDGEKLMNNSVSVTADQVSWDSTKAMIVTAIIIILSTFLSILITRSITNPLSQCVSNLKQIAGGDLTLTCPTNRQDEFGTLSKSMSHMVDNLRVIMGEITQNAHEINKSSGELFSISGEMSSGSDVMSSSADSSANNAQNMSGNMNTVSAAAEEMSTNMTSVSAAVEEMSTNMTTISAAAEEANTNLSAVATASEEASNSLTMVHEAANRSNDNIASITTSVKEVSVSIIDVSNKCKNASNQAQKASDDSQANMAIIETLTRSTAEISNVVKDIEAIAQQTNMLALNASIEASGAGEAGKGFSVVANEVKDLAKQTAIATSDISNKINEIQENTKSVTSATINITDAVKNIATANEDILQAIDEQSKTIEQINNSMASASEETTEVNRRVDESSTGIEEVNRNMQEISSGIGEVVRNVQEVDTGIQELTRTVSETSNAGGEVASNVADAATLSQEMSEAITEIRSMSGGMQEKSAEVEEKATMLSGISKKLDESLANFTL